MKHVIPREDPAHVATANKRGTKEATGGAVGNSSSAKEKAKLNGLRLSRVGKALDC